MEANVRDISIFRALTTVNALLAMHIDADTLAKCLPLQEANPTDFGRNYLKNTCNIALKALDFMENAPTLSTIRE